MPKFRCSLVGEWKITGTHGNETLFGTKNK